MKRSEINQLIRDAQACFQAHGWTLPPNPRWDVTDFGLGNWRTSALVLINLCEEVEYCEKLMYARQGMVTPAHCHRKKKEDIISRWGSLVIQLWADHPDRCGEALFEVQIDNVKQHVRSGERVTLQAGSRITLVPGVYHAFWPGTSECIMGEVSTQNDDLNDNFFVDPNIGRYPGVEEDEGPLLKLVSDR